MSLHEMHKSINNSDNESNEDNDNESNEDDDKFLESMYGDDPDYRVPIKIDEFYVYCNIDDDMSDSW